MPVDPLPLTGERTVPEIDVERYWFTRHEAVYEWLPSVIGAPEDDTDGPGHKMARAAELSAEREAPARATQTPAVVVDAGAGEGYGADSLRANGATVVALDHDEQACQHVASKYPQVHAVRCNLVSLPLATGSARGVVSLQVIEHLWDLPLFLRECRRIAHTDATVVVSTPNREVFSPGLGRGEKPTNPFHVEEFDAEQVHDLMGDAGFGDVEVLGLHHGPRLREWEREHGPLVGAQVEAVTSGAWPEDLLRFITSIRHTDFVISSQTDGCQDLIAVARP